MLLLLTADCMDLGARALTASIRSCACTFATCTVLSGATIAYLINDSTQRRILRRQGKVGGQARITPEI